MKNRSHQCSHSPHLRETADKVRPEITQSTFSTIMANRDVGYNGDNLAHSRSSDKLCAYSHREMRDSDLDPAHTTTMTSTTKGGS